MLGVRDLRDIKGVFTVCTLCNYSDLSLIPVGLYSRSALKLLKL